MNARALSACTARYGLPWTAELCDWLIRLEAWRMKERMRRADAPSQSDLLFGKRPAWDGEQRRRELMEVLDYLRATRPA